MKIWRSDLFDSRSLYCLYTDINRWTGNKKLPPANKLVGRLGEVPFGVGLLNCCWPPDALCQTDGIIWAVQHCEGSAFEEIKKSLAEIGLSIEDLQLADDARLRVERFNRDCPVGTPVILRKDTGLFETVVKASATVLGDHSVVAWFRGVPGCHSIENVTPVAWFRSVPDCCRIENVRKL